MNPFQNFQKRNKQENPEKASFTEKKKNNEFLHNKKPKERYE